ncbi:MAG TPA: hypothetical protein DEF45_16450, partial [Rhodopirellula sp.]|nr:hypothetical protein [Rhodopirellula sp.]
NTAGTDTTTLAFAQREFNQLLPGSGLLVTADIKDFAKLYAKLQDDKSDTSGVSTYLWNNFTSQGKQKISNTSLTESQRKVALVEQLNLIIGGTALRTTNHFDGLTLSSATKILRAKSGLSGDSLIGLHRLL